ncbi:16147_t:CDS:2, partial [Funneliformis caledonium]
TDNKLVNLYEIQFDDLKGRIDEMVKSKYKITHHLVSRHIANELKLETLTGKIYVYGYENIYEDICEQEEILTTRIRNIIGEFSLGKLFNEFLQNADDAGATRFSVIVDERQYYDYNESLLSEEMNYWQGPAIWIYNDAEFSIKDFRALTKLGVGEKFHDDTKIGRFGTGFNCAYHFTDLPSIVSGKYIVFLDPNGKFLPAKGYPPERHRGTSFNFIEKEFKRSFSDQCRPYKALEGLDFIDHCDFTEAFKGSLFRLPLRTRESVGKSDISSQLVETSDILQVLGKIQGNKEMLFLRNIEICNLYLLKEQNQSPQLIWQAQINASRTCREMRKRITSEMQIYQLDIESINILNKKGSEVWLLCTGGHDRVKEKFEKFAREKRLKPRGGVALLLAKSDEKSMDELKFPNPLEFRGEIYSYLPLSMRTNLGVHLNGNFSLSRARNNIIQLGNDFLKADSIHAKWNQYILYDVLQNLHVKLLEHVLKYEEDRFKKDKINFIPRDFLPNGKNLSISFKNYGLNILMKIGFGGHRIFWTKANGGQFISLESAKFLNEKETVITDMLANFGILAVKIDDDRYKQLWEARFRNPKFKYTLLDGKLVCKELKELDIRVNHESLFKLLDFILNDVTDESYELLNGLPLVPLNNGSVGTFGDTYYLEAKKVTEKPTNQDIFPKIGPSKFVSINLPSNLLKIFTSVKFSEKTQIKRFDNSIILDLLIAELPELLFMEELKWHPNGRSIPNVHWLKNIWSILFDEKANVLEYAKLSNFALLPVTSPYNMLIRPNIKNPLLYLPEDGHDLYPVLVKLRVRFTEMMIPESADKSLQKCVVTCTPVNIINSLNKTCSLLSLTMNQLFEKDHQQSQENFMSILKDLPIWPTYSCEEKFINVKSGILYPFDFAFYSFRKNTKFYKYDKTSEYFNLLKKLGAKTITELEYVKNHLFSVFILWSTPSQQYVDYLQNVLSLKNPEIERYFKT